MKELTVSPDEQQVRLDQYLRRLFPQAAGGFLYRMLRKKNITLNDKKATGSERLQTGDVIRVWFSDETYDKLSGSPERDDEYDRLRAFTPVVDIIYEDQDFLFLNKPAGLLSQKAKTADVSLNEHLRAYLIRQDDLSKEAYLRFRPSTMNRLDFGTSGIVLAAKTRMGAKTLSAWIKIHKLKKEYVCVVHGRFLEEGRKRSYWMKDEAQNRVTLFDTPRPGAAEIETVFTCWERSDDFSVVGAELITGKSHQIRTQLAECGHPIVLDAKYGDRKADADLKKRFPYPGQLLHAGRVTLPDGRVFTAPLPAVFTAIMKG